MPSRVELEVGDLEDARTLRCPSAGERPQPRVQLFEREGLRDVVVGACIEADHAVVDAVPGGEQQDGSPPVVGAQTPAHLESVGLGDHHVEHDGVVRVLGAHPHRVGAGHRDVDRIALELERLAYEGRHLGFVLHDQDAHTGIVRRCPRVETHGERRSRAIPTPNATSGVREASSRRGVRYTPSLSDWDTAPVRVR